MASEAVREDSSSGNGCSYFQQHGGMKQDYNMSSFDVNDGSGSEDALLVSTPLLGDGLRGGERVKRQGQGLTNFNRLYPCIITGFSRSRRRGWRMCGWGVLPAWVIKRRLILPLLLLLSLGSFFFRQYYHQPYLKADEWRLHCASQPAFQVARYVSSEPVGILVGVMSVTTENAAKRRMEIRQSWASHWASRGRWEEGKVWSPDELLSLRNSSTSSTRVHYNVTHPTSRVVVRFVLGRPEPVWRDSIREEMNQYNDIIILPIQEKPNQGKTFAFLDWSFKHALVPPSVLQNQTLTRTEGGLEPRFLRGYDDTESGRRHGWARFNAFEARKPAEHDPTDVDGAPFVSKAEWVRPDYVVKAHDDSFMMLAELEARLRTLPRTGAYWGYRVAARGAEYHSGEVYALSWDVVGRVSTYARRHRSHHRANHTPLSVQGLDSYDSRYRKDRPGVSSRGPRKGPPFRRGGGRHRYQNLALNISGQEDLVTAEWMKEHGESWGVTWYSEQCWIYDHPRAGTVNSRGFLFPLEVSKILREWNPFVLREGEADVSESDQVGESRQWTKLEGDLARPEFRRRYDAAYSTVVRAQYRRPYPSAAILELFPPSSPSHVNTERGEWAPKKAMALIEGSKLSMVVAEVDSDAEIARRWKEDLELGWKGLYMLKTPIGRVDLALPLGGTVVVHYVQSSAHWEECIDVLLLGLKGVA